MTYEAPYGYYDLVFGSGRRVRGAYRPGKIHARYPGFTRTLCGRSSNGDAISQNAIDAAADGDFPFEITCGNCRRLAGVAQPDWSQYGPCIECGAKAGEPCRYFGHAVKAGHARNDPHRLRGKQ